MVHQALSRFPPSFDGNPWTYGFALFSLTLVSAISLAILIGYALEYRARREINVAIDNPVTQPAFPMTSPFSLYRWIICGFLLTIVMGALPDVLVLLAWGEASADTMEALFMFDRLADGLLILPYLCSAFLAVWAGQAVDHKLALDSIPMGLRPSWAMMRDRIKMAGLVLFIAIGVTLAKSVA